MDISKKVRKEGPLAVNLNRFQSLLQNIYFYVENRNTGCIIQWSSVMELEWSNLGAGIEKKNREIVEQCFSYISIVVF